MSALQVRKPVNKKALYTWKNYRANLGPLLKGLGPDIVKALSLKIEE